MRYSEIVSETSHAKAGIQKPVPPMSPEQAHREATRKRKIHDRIRDEQSRSSAKVRDLRSEL
jgi:hypothetical protein